MVICFFKKNQRLYCIWIFQKFIKLMKMPTDSTFQVKMTLTENICEHRPTNLGTYLIAPTMMCQVFTSHCSSAVNSFNHIWVMLMTYRQHITYHKKWVIWMLTDPPLDPACTPLFKIFVSPPLFSIPLILRYIRQFPPP